jgi:hypothetical protein
MSNKLGGLPTIELGREALAKYARQADADAVQAESAGKRVTRRPEPDPELEINIDFDDLAVAHADDALAADEPSLPDDGAPGGSGSHVRAETAGAPIELAHVPCIIVCKEDLQWFEVEEAARAVLARIDGESTVEAIVTELPLARETSLAVLRELLVHGVIELQ